MCVYMYMDVAKRKNTKNYCTIYMYIYIYIYMHITNNSLDTGQTSNFCSPINPISERTCWSCWKRNIRISLFNTTSPWYICWRGVLLSNLNPIPFYGIGRARKWNRRIGPSVGYLIYRISKETRWSKERRVLCEEPHLFRQTIYARVGFG